MEQLVAALQDPETRENALLDISKRRDAFVDLAPVLWHSYGVIPALLQEIVAIYPLLSPPSLTNHASNRVCNALALLQCVASHPDTRAQFLNAHVPLFLYPFLNTVSKTRPFLVFEIDEFRSDRSAGESGRHRGDQLSLEHRNYSTVLANDGIRVGTVKNGGDVHRAENFIGRSRAGVSCATAERVLRGRIGFRGMVAQLAEQPSARLLKHIVRCYLRLSDNPRAAECLRRCFPDQLRDPAFTAHLKDDLATQKWLGQLLVQLGYSL